MWTRSVWLCTKRAKSTLLVSLLVRGESNLCCSLPFRCFQDLVHLDKEFFSIHMIGIQSMEILLLGGLWLTFQSFNSILLAPAVQEGSDAAVVVNTALHKCSFCPREDSWAAVADHRFQRGCFVALTQTGICCWRLLCGASATRVCLLPGRALV